ncbi:hypothetical protein OO014_14245 [Intrasporangium calvum]|uniref:Uncharacterized protein n=1 Tax=Intrasporangium calvum TaxID=53358 RepID=A0ABT5GL42_9MICO|nr:hypothetical protein [Intrasporangium calvum]MDC5698416.1 hypothetical protein [Intrasporangium calvum]
MDVLMLTTPIVVMVGLLALMQHIESRMNQNAPVRIATDERRQPMTRAEAVRRHGPQSPLVAAAPFALLVTTAVLLAAAVVRMAG